MLSTPRRTCSPYFTHCRLGMPMGLSSTRPLCLSQSRRPLYHRVKPFIPCINEENGQPSRGGCSCLIGVPPTLLPLFPAQIAYYAPLHKKKASHIIANIPRRTPKLTEDRHPIHTFAATTSSIDRKASYAVRDTTGQHSTHKPLSAAKPAGIGSARYKHHAA